MSFFITHTTGGALASISGNPVTDALKAGELFGVEVDHVAWPTGSDVPAQRAACS